MSSSWNPKGANEHWANRGYVANWTRHASAAVELRTWLDMLLHRGFSRFVPEYGVKSFWCMSSIVACAKHDLNCLWHNHSAWKAVALAPTYIWTVGYQHKSLLNISRWVDDPSMLVFFMWNVSLCDGYILASLNQCPIKVQCSRHTSTVVLDVIRRLLIDFHLGETLLSCLCIQKVHV